MVAITEYGAEICRLRRLGVRHLTGWCQAPYGLVSGTSTAHHNNLLAELDFIINYDIKYRMGTELTTGERMAN